VAKKLHFPKAPTYKTDKARILSRNFFIRFFRKHRELWHLKKTYTDAELKKFILYFNEELGNVAIDNRDGVKLPEGLGHIYMGTIKPDVAVNNKLSNELGRNISFTNNHSDGRVLKIMHTSRGRSYNFENKEMWKFLKAKSLRERASKAFEKNWPKYRELASFREIQKREYDFLTKEEVNINYLVARKNKQRK